MKKKLLFLILFVIAQINASINLVVFSYNRPLQLYAFLESFVQNVQGCDRISVVYRASNEAYSQAYEVVKTDFPFVDFYKQSQDPKSDFKLLTLKAIDFNQEEYIIFAVDDIIVTRPIDLNVCIDSLEREQAYAFFLRLGKNVTECYMARSRPGIPELKKCQPGIYSWQIKQGNGDWCYPHTVDMAIYRKSDIKNFFITNSYTSPNVLEGNWACCVNAKINNSCGLCFKKSCMVNCPLNIIQDVWASNRNSNSYSVDELLELFNNHLKLDIGLLQNCNNPAPHMDYQPTFVSR